MGSAVAMGVAIVVFSVTWVFVAEGELTGTGHSAAFDVRVVIEMRGVVLGEGVLCEMCICLAVLLFYITQLLDISMVTNQNRLSPYLGFLLYFYESQSYTLCNYT